MRSLLIVLVLAALQPPVHLGQLRLLAADLHTAAVLVYQEAHRQDPSAPANDKIRLLSERALHFESAVQGDPASLVRDYEDLRADYQAARTQVDRSASPEVALSFQWLEMLMAKIAMHFGDDSVVQAEFTTPGAAIPPGEMQYTAEGMQELAWQVYILANQVAVRTRVENPVLPKWQALAEAARALHDDPGHDRFDEFERRWLEALPVFFRLDPDERTRENYSLLLSNYVRLRAAYAQIHPR